MWLLATNVVNLYQVTSVRQMYIKTLKAYLLYVVVTSYTIMYLNHIESYHINTNYLLLSMCLFGLHLVIGKIGVAGAVKHSRLFNKPAKRAVIVGGGRAGIELYNRFKNDPNTGYEMIGIFNDQTLKSSHQQLLLGDVNSCVEYSLENSIDEIFCALPLSKSETIEKLISESDKNMIRFKLVPEHYRFFQGSLLEHSINNLDAYSIRVEPLEDLSNRFIKRSFDIAFSLFVIVFILSWLYPILYILIKLESEGPAIFVQPRSGRDNVSFNCFKFRSMVRNKDSNHMQATKGDARVTKFGAFLRKTSLDEMPQFFNVLMGDMSVVGPRPHMLNHTAQYSKLIDQFMVRHYIKPGITGWAQVTGHRGETKLVEDMKARVEADVWYMENWSFTLDIKIIFSTFFKSIIGDKYAY